MDSHNLFATRFTYRWLRAEYGIALVLSLVAAVAHFGQIRWIPFLTLFVYIDVIGYIPGAIAFRRAAGHSISRIYYVLYNAMHSLVSAAVVAGAWCLVFGPEWALLALPIHLMGDRALFGNFLKPFGVTFEPATHPLFAEFSEKYQALNPSAAASATAVAEERAVHV